MVWWVIRLQCNHEVPPNSKIATGGVLRKRCSLKFRNIHRRTLGLESLFNKVADLQACKLIKKRLIHVFSCEWLIYCEILKNVCEQNPPTVNPPGALHHRRNNNSNSFESIITNNQDQNELQKRKFYSKHLFS